MAIDVIECVVGSRLSCHQREKSAATSFSPCVAKYVCSASRNSCIRFLSPSRSRVSSVSSGRPTNSASMRYTNSHQRMKAAIRQNSATQFR